MTYNDSRREQLFREELFEKGLGWDINTLPQGIRHFFFDLDSGGIYSEPDPEKVMAIVSLAREYASGDLYGEHNSLLQLVAALTDFSSERGVFWHQTIHVGTLMQRGKWVSLYQWLMEMGQDPDSVYSPETLAQSQPKLAR